MSENCNDIRQAENIAVIRLDGLGDSLLAKPAVSYLIKQCPKAKVTVFTSRLGTSVFAGTAETAEIDTKDKKKASRQLEAALKELNPEYIFCFTEKGYALKAAGRMRSARRIGYFPGLSQPLKSLALYYQLSDRVNWNNDPHKPSSMHEAERFFLLLEKAGLKKPEDIGPIELSIPEETERIQKQKAHSMAKKAAEALSFKTDDPQRFAALQLMPRWNQDVMRLSQSFKAGKIKQEEFRAELSELFKPVTEIYKYLISKKLPVLFSCAPCDREWAENYLHTLPEKDKFQEELPLFCSESLHEFAAFLKQADFLITPDGGAAHAASSVQTPMVIIFPPQNLQNCLNRWLPWRTECKVAVKGQDNGGSDKNFIENLKEACAYYADRNQRRNSDL